MENAQRLANGLAIDMIVAWRIHHLTTWGQETPDVPCTVYFTEFRVEGAKLFAGLRQRKVAAERQS